MKNETILVEGANQIGSYLDRYRNNRISISWLAQNIFGASKFRMYWLTWCLFARTDFKLSNLQWLLLPFSGFLGFLSVAHSKFLNNTSWVGLVTRVRWRILNSCKNSVRPPKTDGIFEVLESPTVRGLSPFTVN